tara:strand:+ start:251 stop:1177 length:927 start_codon:yes stop_codon:yes gene_type:complete
MPINTGAVPGSNALTTEVAIQFAGLMLGDRSNLRNHPALLNLNAYGFGRVGSGSGTYQWPIFDWDRGALTAYAEGVTITEDTLSSLQRQLAAARYGGMNAVTDDMRAVDPTGSLAPMRFMMHGVAKAAQTLTDLIAKLTTGWSSQVGTTAVAMTHDTFIAAKKALIQNSVPGPYMLVWHQDQHADWIDDLEARTGVTQWRPATAEQMRLRGPGFQGSYDGVDIFTTDKVADSGGDWVGQMIGGGAIAFGEQEIVAPEDANILFHLGPILVEAERTASDSVSSVYTSYRVGVIEVEDGRGCGLLSVKAP